MDKKALYTLEFDKIIDRLVQKATSEPGKKFAGNILPMTNPGRIKRALNQSNDALKRIMKKGALSLSGLFDIRPFEDRLRLGGGLSQGELLSIVSLLSAAERAKAYGTPEKDDTPKDSIDPLFEEIEVFSDLRKEISRCIISEEEIADDASGALASIRRSLSKMNGRIHDRLSSFLSSQNGDYLQDRVIVQRDGHYCLPVRAEFKSRIPGLVHDSSASGSTLFIEPMAVLELGNELRELKKQESEEIERILLELSGRVAGIIDSLSANCKVLTLLDFIFAKGSLASEMNAQMPLYNNDGIIRLRKARHPLLDPASVVPIDVSLGENYTQLVVTGPNTGGKTVSLKTVGLLSLMGQAGLLIPAADRSTLCIFSDIRADIGDEQSIEQSLSTFSSHMTNIVRILDSVHKAPTRTLVLFDELCAGTDPAEGAALAAAILDLLRKNKVPTMATTHYSELKVYALSQEGVENASLEFDVESLSPTYRLLIGVPGKSNAFAISKKLGLSKEIISDAKKRLSEDSLSFEELLVDLENKRRIIEEDQKTIENDRAQIAAEKERILSQKEKIASQKADILAKANEKASNILRDAKLSADAAIRNINKYGGANADIAKMEASRRNLGKKLSHTQSASQAKNNSQENKKQTVDPKKLRIGDRVHVKSLNIDGTVHSLPNTRGELVVTMGIMQSKVNVKDLILLSEPDSYSSKPKKSSVRTGLSKALSVSPEIKLLGMTVDEALTALDKYLDDARLSHLDSVRVVHGKGTGALRKAVHDYLRRQPVSGYHLAEYGEGDSGVTIVEL